MLLALFFSAAALAASLPPGCSKDGNNLGVTCDISPALEIDRLGKISVSAIAVRYLRCTEPEEELGLVVTWKWEPSGVLGGIAPAKDGVANITTEVTSDTRITIPLFSLYGVLSLRAGITEIVSRPAGLILNLGVTFGYGIPVFGPNGEKTLFEFYEVPVGEPEQESACSLEPRYHCEKDNCPRAGTLSPGGTAAVVIVVLLVVLAGAAVGAYFVFFRNKD